MTSKRSYAWVQRRRFDKTSASATESAPTIGRIRIVAFSVSFQWLLVKRIPLQFSCKVRDHATTPSLINPHSGFIHANNAVSPDLRHSHTDEAPCFLRASHRLSLRSLRPYSSSGSGYPLDWPASPPINPKNGNRQKN